MIDFKKVMEGTPLQNVWVPTLLIKAPLKILFMKLQTRRMMLTKMTSLYGQLNKETSFWDKNWPIFKNNTQNKLKPSIKLYTLKNGKTDSIANN